MFNHVEMKIGSHLGCFRKPIDAIVRDGVTVLKSIDIDGSVQIRERLSTYSMKNESFYQLFMFGICLLNTRYLKVPCHAYKKYVMCAALCYPVKYCNYRKRKNRFNDIPYP